MSEQTRVEFAKPSRDEQMAIETIVRRLRQRGWDEGFPTRDAFLQHWSMNLLATHYRCPLDLAALADADDFTLLHDCDGIERHLDKETGILAGHFLPRVALPESVEED